MTLLERAATSNPVPDKLAGRVWPPLSSRLTPATPAWCPAGTGHPNLVTVGLGEVATVGLVVDTLSAEAAS